MPSVFAHERTVATSGFHRWLAPFALCVYLAIAIAYLGIPSVPLGGLLAGVSPRRAMVTTALCFGGGLLVAALGIAWHQLRLLYLGYSVLGGHRLGYVSPIKPLRNIGEEDLGFVVTFHNGSYQDVALTQLLAAGPRCLLSNNFRVPSSTFAKFADKRDSSACPSDTIPPGILVFPGISPRPPVMLETASNRSQAHTASEAGGYLSMNWRNFDLNLLVVFDAVLHERSATAAAAKLNMTQPAVSQALSRLRGALRDELFVRTPIGMTPTPFAIKLAEPVRRALQQLDTAFDGAAEFEPASAERTFKVVLNNHSALVIAPHLATALAAEAPGIVLDLRPSGTLNIIDLLDRGELDAAIGSLAAPGERFNDVRLFDDGFAAMLRRGHPAAGADGTIGIEALARVPHLAVSSTGEGTAFVDEALAQHGLARRVALHAPLLTTGAVLAQSEMVAVLSTRAAHEFARYAPLQVLQLPFASPQMTTALLWARRLDGLAAHRWLRSIIIRTAKAL